MTCSFRSVLRGLAFVTVGLSIEATAAAYQTASVITDPCHERITFDGLREAREATQRPEPVDATANERALIDDAPFPIPSGMKELGAVTLALGNRDVDLRGNEPDDLDRLAPLHGAPGRQDEHCLRRADQDGPAGNEAALQDCREFILSQVRAALEGVNDDGTIDASVRVPIDVYLDLRGVAEAELPVYYVAMGRALHALQDGFSHTYRTADHLRVTSVLNYVELAEDRLEPSEDGPPHSSPLDACVSLDDFRSERLEMAARASMDLLLATTEPGLRPAEREAAAEEVLLDYLSYEPGCTADNGFCDAPEARYKSSGCSVGGGLRARGTGGWAGASGLLLLLAALRKRHGRPRASSMRNGVTAWVMALVALSASDARASEVVASDLPSGEAVSDTGEVESYQDADSEGADEPFPLGVIVAGSAAVQETALAASVGARYRFGEHWQIGLDGEYNPWIVRRTGEIRAGSTNLYATGVVRFPMNNENVNLRSTLHLGASRMNFDLFGVPQGSWGPFIGVNFLGVDIELSRALYLVIDPAHIAVPIPQIDGVVYAYPQYRVRVGLQLGS